MKGYGNPSFRYLKGPLIKIFRVDAPYDCIILIYLTLHEIPSKGLERDAVLLSRYVKGVPFFNGRYTKGVPFLSKMVYKRVRGWTSGGASPYKTLLSAPTPASTQASF